MAFGGHEDHCILRRRGMKRKRKRKKKGIGELHVADMKEESIERSICSLTYQDLR